MALEAGVTQLNSGETLLVQLNPAQWRWYQMPLEDNGTFYNAVVNVDSETLLQSAGVQVWARFDVLILNGTLPGNAQTEEPGPVVSGSPYCWIDELCPSNYALQYADKERVTASFGFNATAPGGHLPPQSHLVIGVRADITGFGVTKFSLSVTRLPRELRDGMVINSAVAPCGGEDDATCRQYFTVPVGGYDVLELLLERTGDNLTKTTSKGEVVSNGGRGLVGDLYVGGPSTYWTPPPFAFDEARTIGNTTASISVDYFCTLARQAGTYTVALIPGSSGGFGAELLTTDAERAIDAGVARQGRGRYRLRVRHAIFADGLLSPTGGTGGQPDVRPGCVGYGQTRNYTLRSHGMEDANLYVELRGANVSAIRARCDGCEWVSATPPIQRLAMSPCQMRNGTSWQVQVELADQLGAMLAGVAPTEFTLHTELQNATAEPGVAVRPRSAGGSGYVCCGATVSYLLPHVPRTHALAIRFNLSVGTVRAAFLKHDACATPEADVEGAECMHPQCELRWLTVYDEFYGNMIHTYSEYFAIPFGPSPWNYDPATTKRREGDWYISIASLPGISAEFELVPELIEPPRPPVAFSCSRFVGFCPKKHYHAGLGITSSQLEYKLEQIALGTYSSGGRRAHTLSPTAHATAALATAAVLVMQRMASRWRPRQGRA